MNIIGTRDLRARLEELRDKQEEIQSKKDELAELESQVPDEGGDKEDLNEEIEELESEIEDLEYDFDGDEKKELAELEKMESEIPYWQSGDTLIDEDHWIEYCREFLSDAGVIPAEMPPYIVIDWEATADNLKSDYSEIEYRGITYLYRY